MTGAPDAASQLAGLSLAVLLIDPGHAIFEANAAAEELLDRSARRLTGMAIIEAVQIGDRRVRDSLLRVDTPLVARDVPLTAGGRERRVDLTSSPLTTHPGWRVVALSEAGRGGDEPGAPPELRAPTILAHEIKNPLAAIRGASQLLARRIDPRDAPLAVIIASEVDRIAELIDRMQQLGATQSVTLRACNLHEAVRRAMASTRAAGVESIKLVEAFDPSLPPVSADPAALTQVLINLLDNARDACENCANPRVEVRTRFISGLTSNGIRSGKDTRLPVEIVVTDNGLGIDPSLRDHLFEPFVTSKPNGQGLGLALVRKLIRDMGGRIAHERDENAGLTHFRVNLAVDGGRSA